MIISILNILLAALVALLVLKLCFFIIGKFLTLPPDVVQIVYAIVGVIFIIWIVEVVVTGSSFRLTEISHSKP